MIPKRMTTKEIIIEVAGNLFMEKGFQATSTREIAEIAQITQPNLYHHFKTKEDIYIAVLEKLAAEVKIGLEVITLENDATLVESLSNVLNYLREKHPANFSIMSHDMTYEISKENNYYLYQIWQSSYLSPIEKLFEKYKKEDVLFTSEELARYFYSAIAPFIQKDNDFYKEVTSEKIIYLFVYGILDRGDKENI